MNYWLVKTEPSTYSFQDLLRDKKTTWDGVRNYQARNNLKLMKKDDQILVYHSVNEKAVVGTAKVGQEYFPDPTIEDARWVAVELLPGRSLRIPISLEQIKADSRLAHMVLVHNSRLSVQPVDKDAFETILQMAE